MFMLFNRRVLPLWYPFGNWTANEVVILRVLRLHTYFVCVRKTLERSVLDKTTLLD
jgi:hypothetical protein